VVPFVNKKAVGSVFGVVGAGGNAGAVAAGFLFRSPELSMASALFWLGVAVLLSAGLAFTLRFASEEETQAAAGERLPQDAPLPAE
jgi:NNP family nitrate/nitrite transporter-like MFS transporter